MTTLFNKVTEQVVEIEEYGVAVFAKHVGDAANWVRKDSGEALVPAAAPAASKAAKSKTTNGDDNAN
jgi:hypothetical protein